MVVLGYMFIDLDTFIVLLGQGFSDRSKVIAM